MAIVARSELESLLQDLETPHVDLSRILGTYTPVIVSVTDIDALLKSEVPTFHVTVDNVSVSFSNQNHGFMANLEVKLP